MLHKTDKSMEMEIVPVETFYNPKVQGYATQHSPYQKKRRMDGDLSVINQTSSATIQHLPLEIVVKVFKHYIFPISTSNTKSATRSTPLFIGSICRSWRKIAWSTPSLWSSFSLAFCLDESLSDTKMELLERWLSRTGNLPLSITIYGQNDDADVDSHEDDKSDDQADEGFDSDIQMEEVDSEWRQDVESSELDDQNDDNPDIFPDSYYACSLNESRDHEESYGDIVYEDNSDSDWITCASDDDDDDETKTLESSANSRHPNLFFNLMNRYASRWHSIDFRISTDWLQYFRLSSPSLPNLKRLSLRPSYVDGETFLDLGGFPTLESITLVNRLPNVLLHLKKVQWNQILRLELTVCSIEDCMEILSQTPQIISCTFICLLRCREENWRFRKQILLPSLEELSVANEQNLDLQHFLDTLSAPNLSSFSYDAGELVTNNCSSICGFISRSPFLHTFTLRKANITSHDILIQLLRGLRKIVRFNFVAVLSPSSVSFDDHILALCTPHGVDDAECLLPAVENLVYTGPQTFTWAAMSQFIASRKPESLGEEPGYISVIRSAVVMANQSSSPKELWVCPCRDCQPSYVRDRGLLLPLDPADALMANTPEAE